MHDSSEDRLLLDLEITCVLALYYFPFNFEPLFSQGQKTQLIARYINLKSFCGVISSFKLILLHDSFSVNIRGLYEVNFRISYMYTIKMHFDKGQFTRRHRCT